MGGEHGGEAGALDRGAELGRSGPGCPSGRGAAASLASAWPAAPRSPPVDAADIGGEAARPVGEGGVAQVADQGGDLRHR